MKGSTDRPLNIGFAGNPNCGKTTLFNALTGASFKVANWPGVTVERVEGEIDCDGRRLRLIDLPGLYSLTGYSMEERVSCNSIREDEIDVIVNVVDASCLERSLYLTMQLLEQKKPLVLALNMMDIVKKRGMRIDTERLSELLGGIPVVPVSARRRTGLDALLRAAVQFHEKEIRRYPTKALHRSGRSCEPDTADGKYDYIENVVEQCLFDRNGKAAVTEKLDAVLTHRIWGIPFFMLIMACVFFLTFTAGDCLKGCFEKAFQLLSALLASELMRLGTADWLVSLIVDGILAGVGGILTFLPNIAILFLALAFLEDSGYMARVAYIMDSVMGRVGLSGKAFLPMILGFGCTVPAVMASRTLESEQDRRRTIRLIPFMSCSAKLPIYVLFAEMFFPDHAVLAAYSLYLLGMITAVGVALAEEDQSVSGEEYDLLIELPEYKVPDAYTVAVYVREKLRDYLTKAGTIIFLASMVLWFLLHYGPGGMAAEIAGSFAAKLGHVLAPLLAPAGLGMWQIAVALLGGLSAKEVVVSSLAVLFDIGNINSAAGMSKLAAILAENGFGPVNACAFMVFCLYYSPCIAAIASVYRETRSLCYTLRMAAFQMLFAWMAAAAVYQVGSLLF